jgi:hypothetical protein
MIASINAKPATGPSRIATATARFNPTTGEADTRARRSYKPTMWFHGVQPIPQLRQLRHLIRNPGFPNL